MKSQIALLALGVVIAGGVSFAELKPADTSTNPITVVTPVSTQSSTAPTVASNPASEATPTAVSTTVNAAVPTQSKPTKISTPTIAKPNISGGGQDNEGDHEGGDDD